MPDSSPSPGLLQKLLSMLAPTTQQVTQQSPVNPDTGLSAAPSPNLLQRMVNGMGMNTVPSNNTAQPNTMTPTPGTPEYYEYMQKRPLGTQGVKRNMFDFLGR